MGRGTGNKKGSINLDPNLITKLRSVSRSIEDYIESERSEELVGTTLEITPDESLTFTENDYALTMKGMADVDYISYLSNKEIWEITFADGEKVRVDLNNMSVSGDGSGETDEGRLRGALAYALAESVSLGGAESPAEINLQNAHEAMQANPNATDFRKRAISAIAVLEDNGAPIELGDSTLFPAMSSDDLSDFDPRASVSLDSDFSPAEKEALGKIYESVGPDGRYPASAGLALVGRIDAKGERFGEAGVCSSEEYEQAALELAGNDPEKAEMLIPNPNIVLYPDPKLDKKENPIYILDDDGEKIPFLSPVGDELFDDEGNKLYVTEMNKDENGVLTGFTNVGSFVIDSKVKQRMTIVNNAVLTGTRLINAIGRPGAGKNAEEDEFAAMNGMPLSAFTFSSGTDLQSLLGGDALEARTEYNKDGDVVGVAATSVCSVGPLAEALGQPGAVSLRETIEIGSHELTAFNSAGTENLGETEGRFVTISSVKGKMTFKVHPDCIIFSSFNQGPADERLAPSFHERGVNLVYDLPDTDEMSKRMAQQVTKVMSSQDLYPDLKRKWTAAEIKPFVEVMQGLNKAYDEGKPEVIMEVGPRVMTTAIPQLLIQAYTGKDNAEPIESFNATLHYALKTVAFNEDQRNLYLQTISNQQSSSINDLIDKVRGINPALVKLDEEKAKEDENNAKSRAASSGGS